MSRRFRSLAYSIALHAGLFLALFSFTTRLRENPNPKNKSISFTVEDLKHNQKPSSGAKSNTKVSHRSQVSSSHPASRTLIDLRPDFAKGHNSIPYGIPSGPPEAQQNWGNPQAQELLTKDGRSLQAFDRLAMLINGHLDYPQMLAENGVYGLATLELYFDHEARIDEGRSRFFGDNRWVRGLLVGAVRKGLVAWYNDIGGRLEREKFRNQYFRADFVITYISTHSSDLQKVGEGSYQMVRRSLVQTCLNPTLGGIDVACVAMRVAGAVSSQLSEKYKMRYHALKDRLEALDDQGLRWINQEIQT